MQIRRAKSADEEALRNIRRSAILGLATRFVSAQEAEEWVRDVAPDRFSHAIRAHEVWVAGDDEVIGWIEVDCHFVAGLYVKAEHSGRGVGSALLFHAEAVMRSAGHATSGLEASQNALDFYVRRGYRRVGSSSPNGAHPMVKKLTARQPGSVHDCESS